MLSNADRVALVNSAQARATLPAPTSSVTGWRFNSNHRRPSHCNIRAEISVRILKSRGWCGCWLLCSRSSQARPPCQPCYNNAMTTINLDDMQRDLLTYLERVAAGETLLIMQADRPIAELKPPSYDAAAKQLRPIGLGAGDFTVPDDFDALLPDDLLNSFEGR